MIETTTTMTLNHPPEQVFDFLADFENEPAWNPECISVDEDLARSDRRRRDVRRTHAQDRERPDDPGHP